MHTTSQYFTVQREEKLLKKQKVNNNVHPSKTVKAGKK